MDPASGRQPTRDHIIPKSKAKDVGLNGRNKIIACKPCNTDKGSRSLGRWAEILADENDERAMFVRAVQEGRALSNPEIAYYERRIQNLERENRRLRIKCGEET